MGDQDELGVVRHVPHVLGEAGDVDVVEGRFDLVEDAERGGCDLQDGEQQGDGGQAFLTAGQKVDVLDILARGLDLDADGTLEDVRLIFQDQGRFTAAEEFGEGGAEGLVDAGELFGELLRHVAGEFLDEVEEFLAGPFYIADLVGEELIPLGDFLVFFDGADVDGAKGFDLLPHLGEGGAGAGRVLGGLRHFGRFPAGQLVLVVQLVDGVVVVAEHVGLALFETGEFAGDLLPLGRLVALEVAKFFAFGLGFFPLRGEFVDLFARCIALRFEAGDLLIQFGDLCLQLLILCDDAGDLLFEGPGPLIGGRRGLFVVADGLAVGFDVLREGQDGVVQVDGGGGGFLEGLADLLHAAGGVVGLLLDGFDLGVEVFRLGFGFGRFLLQFGDALVRGRLLFFDLLKRGPDGGKLALGEFQRALGTDLLFVRVDEVGLDGFQFGAGVRGFRFRLVELGFGGGHLLGQFFRLFAQVLDLTGPGHESRVLHPGTAGHGTAGVDDLTVQRDDLEPVFIFPADADRRVHVFHDHGPGQLCRDDLFVLFVRLHEVGCDVDVSEAVVEAALLQRSAADGGDGQEGGAAASGVFQELDGLFRVVLVVDDQELDGAAEGGLDGNGILVGDGQELGQRTVDALQGPAAGFPHDGLDRAGIAFHVFLEVFEHPDPAGLLFGLPAQGLEGLLLLGELFVPLLLPEFITVDRVLQGRDRLVAGLEMFLRFLHFAGEVQVQGAALTGRLLRPRGTVFDLLDGGLGGRLADEGVRQFGGEVRKLLGVAVLRVFLPADGGAELFAPVGDGLHLRLFFGDLRLQCFDLFLGFRDETFRLGLALRRLLLGLAEPLDGLLVEFDGVLRDRDVRVQFRDLLLVAGGREADLFDLQRDGPGRFCRGFRVRFDLGEGLFRLLVLHAGDFDLVLLLLQFLLQVIDIVEPEGDLQLFLLFREDQELLGLLGLGLQGTDAGLEFREDVSETDEVLLGTVEAPDGVLTAVPEMGDACGFFEHVAAAGGLGRDHVRDFALGDHRVAVAAEAGVHEELVDVLQSDLLAVDAVLGLTRTEVPAGNGDLFLVVGQAAVRVVEPQRDFRITQRPALVRAAEDDVFHLGTAQVLRGLFAEDPADRVGNIRFSGAVRAHDRRHAAVKFQHGLVREGLETLQFECFQNHR